MSDYGTLRSIKAPHYATLLSSVLALGSKKSATLQFRSSRYYLSSRLKVDSLILIQNSRLRQPKDHDASPDYFDRFLWSLH